MNFTTSKELESFNEKIIFHGCFFTCAKFHGKITIESSLSYSFLQLQYCDKAIAK